MIINTMKKYKGFTLIEVMIVVVIIGIIAGIGYPSYTKYLHKAGRSEASAMLLEIMEKQEQHYRREMRYTATLSDLGFATATVETESGRFKVGDGDMKACDGTSIRRCVEIKAVAQGKQPSGDDLTLTSKGEKSGWD